MKKGLIFYFIIFLVSCKNESDKAEVAKGTQWKTYSRHHDFVDGILDFTIERKDDQIVELPRLYDSLATQIPDDSNEQLILVEALKNKGFKVIESGRGNYPPCGVRYVGITMQKAGCICEVYKTYNITITGNDNYEMKEGISCMDSTSYFKNKK